jgi:hypothetical protein
VHEWCKLLNDTAQRRPGSARQLKTLIAMTAAIGHSGLSRFLVGAGTSGFRPSTRWAKCSASNCSQTAGERRCKV